MSLLSKTRAMGILNFKLGSEPATRSGDYLIINAEGSYINVARYSLMTVFSEAFPIATRTPL